MQLIIDFSDSNPDGRMIVLPRRRLLLAATAAAAVLALCVYFAATLVAAYWVTSGADIVADIAKKEIRAVNDARQRLWLESVDTLEEQIAETNARIIALHRKGSILSERLGLPGNEMFSLNGFDKEQNALLCAANDDSEQSPEEQQIKITDILYRQGERLGTLERKYRLLRDQGIHNIVLEDTLPIERPIAGKNWVSSRYGYRRDPFTGRRAFHTGYDYAARRGTPIIAGAEGIVIYAGRLGNYGNAVHLYHGDDISTLYGHMHKIHVKAWQYVRKGEVIGTVGSTGRSTGPHLHYEVRIKNRPKSVLRTIKQLRKQRNLPSSS